MPWALIWRAMDHRMEPCARACEQKEGGVPAFLAQAAGAEEAGDVLNRWQDCFDENMRQTWNEDACNLRVRIPEIAAE